VTFISVCVLYLSPELARHFMMLSLVESARMGALMWVSMVHGFLLILILLVDRNHHNLRYYFVQYFSYAAAKRNGSVGCLL